MTKDNFTSTVDGAAAFERHRGDTFDDDNRPTLSELASEGENSINVIYAADTSEADWDPAIFGMTYKQYRDWRHRD